LHTRLGTLSTLDPAARVRKELTLFPDPFACSSARACFMVAGCGGRIMLVVSTPLCCAIFPQQAEIKIENLEPELRAKVF
jgi:hypothetical protein